MRLLLHSTAAAEFAARLRRTALVIGAIAQRRHFFSRPTASSFGFGRRFISSRRRTCSTDGWQLDLFRARYIDDATSFRRTKNDWLPTSGKTATRRWKRWKCSGGRVVERAENFKKLGAIILIRESRRRWLITDKRRKLITNERAFYKPLCRSQRRFERHSLPLFAVDTRLSPPKTMTT